MFKNFGRKIYPILLLFICACQNQSNYPAKNANDLTDSLKNSQQKSKITNTTNCDSIIGKLIHTSNYRTRDGDNDFNFSYLDGDVSDTSMSIKITKIIFLEEKTKIINKTELPQGWLELNFAKKQLWDVTYEDSITKLKCDTNLINLICLHCATKAQLFGE